LGNLSRVHYPGGTWREYHYEDARFPHALTGITDERGIRYTTWRYDALGRAVLSEHAGAADRTRFAYTSSSTTVTNALGKQSVYRLTEIHGRKRVTSIDGQATTLCAAASRRIEYDTNGYVRLRTDAKGNTTVYTRDHQGRELSRTEGYGTPKARTISTEWHPTLSLPVKITEPHQITHISYDEKGRVLSRQVQPR
jgi:YD repeat-containing protein